MLNVSVIDSSNRYQNLLMILVIFTALDVFTTIMGLTVGCIELNPIVMKWGLPIWTLFRILLSGGMFASFFIGHRICLVHFQTGAWLLQTILTILDIFIVIIVFSGFFAIISTLIFH